MQELYLIDAKVNPEGVTLTFFNAANNIWKNISKKFKPYFFIPHPISSEDTQIIRRLNASSSIAEKQNLFTNQKGPVTKVEIDPGTKPSWIAKRFKKSWEGGIPVILSYVYDKNLTFGALHEINDKQIRPLFRLSIEKEKQFQKKFHQLKNTDPLKYSILERLFMLCSQPIPIIPSINQINGRGFDLGEPFLPFMLSRIANLPISTSSSNRRVSSWIRSILNNYLRRHNILIPTSNELRRNETKKQIQGALTFKPKEGIHFNTVVVDFESLYPSIIDTYNLSYETIDCIHKPCQNQRLSNLPHYICNQRRGVYSLLIGAIKDLRIHWYKPLSKDKTIAEEERKLAKASSELLKLILVSSYGVTIRIHGLSRPSLAETITAYGRYILQSTWNLAENLGLFPIYGDTDSLFLENPNEELVRTLISSVKKQFKLDLAVDERYSVCVLPRAMKAYFGVRTDGTYDIKGVAAIKSNSPPIIQKVFRACVKEIAKMTSESQLVEIRQQIKIIIKEASERIKTGKILLEDLKYVVKLHEDPAKKEKEKTLHQPYQCARQLIDQGRTIQKGDTVLFIKVKPFNYKGKTFTVKPIHIIKTVQEINVDDYIRNLQTALNQTLKFFNLEIEKPTKIKLSDFM